MMSSLARMTMDNDIVVLAHGGEAGRLELLTVMKGTVEEKTITVGDSRLVLFGRNAIYGMTRVASGAYVINDAMACRQPMG